MSDGPGAVCELEQLLDYVKRQRGFDFSGYKKPSLQRRIGRLQARHVETCAEYRRVLEDDPDEFVELFNTILINVTSFFRDEFAWSYLAETIIPRLLAARDNEPIRVWSAGCATGEEAFSLAILFAEAMDRGRARGGEQARPHDRRDGDPDAPRRHERRGHRGDPDDEGEERAR